MPMVDVPIGRPGSGGGGASGFDRADHLGHSVAFVNNDERKQVPTRHGPNDAVFSDYVVCITDDKVYFNHLTFGVAIVPAILAGTEAVVLGTLARGDASAGKSAAWLLMDPTDDEYAAAQAWFNAHSATLPSGKLVIEEPPTNEQPF